MQRSSWTIWSGQRTRHIHFAIIVNKAKMGLHEVSAALQSAFSPSSSNLKIIRSSQSARRTPFIYSESFSVDIFVIAVALSSEHLVFLVELENSRLLLVHKVIHTTRKWDTCENKLHPSLRLRKRQDLNSTRCIYLHHRVSEPTRKSKILYFSCGVTEKK